MKMTVKKTMTACIACLFSVSLAHAAVGNKPVPDKKTLIAPRTAAAAKAAPEAKPLDLPTLTAQQIVDRNVAARGGLAAWQGVQSMSMTGKLDAGKVKKDGGTIGITDKRKAKAELRKTLFDKSEATAEKIIQLPFQLDMQRPLKTRLEIPFQGQTAVQVYDGTQGWKLRPFLGRHEVEPFSSAELKLAADQQQLDGPLINHAAKGTKVAVDGTDLVDGHDTYRLKLTLKNGDVRRLWVDARTFLDVKFEGALRHFDGEMRPVATYFRDYKAVDGLMIPHLLVTAVEGTRVSENIVVEKVALNVALDDSRFKKPQ